MCVQFHAIHVSLHVQVDQQWLEEVGGVCEGEDIDRMMAQAIALEDTHRATARDHLYGIDDSVLQEGQYANRVRGNLYSSV